MEEGHFDLILLETSQAIAQFALKIKQNPHLNGLLLQNNHEKTSCPYLQGFLGLFDLLQPESLVQFLKQYFKTFTKKAAMIPITHTIDFVAKSKKMLELFEKAKKIAKTQSSVLITGESGTGKEVIAHLIHEHSFRSNHAFVAINSCAISPHLLESELFGYEKGAFTGAMSRKIGRIESANHGTFFSMKSEKPLLNYRPNFYV